MKRTLSQSEFNAFERFLSYVSHHGKDDYQKEWGGKLLDILYEDVDISVLEQYMGEIEQ